MHAFFIIVLILSPVFQMWRHGDRSPTNTFRNDPYQEDAWPQGWGQLTATGMKQHFALGTRLRAMYNSSFISTVYTPSEIYVRSTDFDRTLMSAMSNLEGFYQAEAVGVTYPNTNGWPSHFSPIPVHTVEFSTDHIGNAFPICPRADQLYKAIQQNDSYQSVTAQNQALFDFLTKVTGQPISLDSSIRSLQDTLFIEKVYNLTMPTWLNDSIWNQMINLTEISNDFNFGIFPPQVPELIKLRGGSLLKSIVNEMQLKLFCMQNPLNTTSACRAQLPRKYYIYSSHDTTLAAFLTTLGDEHQVLNMGMPKYASSILFELWNTTAGPQVKILYHPSFNMPFYPITNLTEGCPSNSDYCSLDTFVSRSQKYMPIDIDAECQPK